MRLVARRDRVDGAGALHGAGGRAQAPEEIPGRRFRVALRVAGPGLPEKVRPGGPARTCPPSSCVIKDTELEKLQNCLQFVWY